MELKIYSIRDAKGDAYGQIIIQRTHGEAERFFKNQINEANSFYGKYPEDFDLYYIGNMDNVSGKITPTDTPQHVIKGVQLKEEINRTVQ